MRNTTNFYDALQTCIAAALNEALPPEAVPAEGRSGAIEVLSLDVIDAVRREFGGQQIYVPEGHYWRVEDRWIKIYEDSCKATDRETRVALARKYGITEKYLTNVINKGRALSMARKQLPLF